MAMPYMYCILRTVFLDHVRKRKRRPEKLVAEIADDDRFYGGADIEIDDEVRDAFRKLPERSQIALNLKYHEGWKTAQIAEALELRPNQVSRLMYSALEKIRKELASKPAQLRKSEE
ncbi:RNA polymerase sigma factor (sigma-70 family) [Nocardia tenerifensis]|uniref:RNA polymerase sigma factor (Sigma-70 family) n=2 Tax=Nocardia tenerifensis TaxID=228006 RepID=A0A318JKC5_9NOCA|nr:RNA polymerase sigma factor (sigma-70 family) [Nocardia tenerifensis]